MTVALAGVPTALDHNITEARFLGVTLEVATLFRWMVYHPPDNRPITSKKGTVYRQQVAAGWPDLVLARAGTVLVRELKTRTGRVSAAQTAWHAALTAAGLDVAVWRPADWPSIVATLGMPAGPP